MHKVTLLTLTCHVPDETYGDEVYLMLGDRKIWPDSEKFENVKVGEYPLKVELDEFSLGDSIEVELWDHDVVSANDKLGTFKLILDKFGGGYVTEMTKVATKKASYSLAWDFY